ncbi:MAG: NUDIX domain-containing protein [Candidatus Aenigmarchaeota archaeon]|nr:NUDIX domain-containing protein [Candidatus Aenigmarchaeota archaeon]
MKNKIHKIGAAIIKNNKILVVREAGWEKYGLPGGTIKENEEVFDCLEREIKEELNVDVKKDSLEYLGIFEDVAMNEANTIIQIKLYKAELESEPSKTSEVEDMFWFGKDDDFEKLGPIDKNKIIPALINKGLIK